MQTILEYLQINSNLFNKIELSVFILFFLLLGKIVANRVIRRKIDNPKRKYHLNRAVLYIYTILVIIFVSHIWISGIQSLTTFLGLASAGLAIALHDTIANIAGWLFIITRKPFTVGDRIQIGDTAGDVIDIRVFQFSLIEIGNWVEADQSTGRIVHVPNSKVLRDPLSNYQIGFDYIWNEIPVLLTFESNWKKAKEILNRIAREKAENLSEGAQQQIRCAAEKYLIFYNTLTPIIYTSVKESGVMLTIRYIVKPRQRRTTEELVWEAVLDAFADESDIELAYPTTRFYTQPPAPATGMHKSVG